MDIPRDGDTSSAKALVDELVSQARKHGWSCLTHKLSDGSWSITVRHGTYIQSVYCHVTPSGVCELLPPGIRLTSATWKPGSVYHRQVQKLNKPQDILRYLKDHNDRSSNSE